MGFATAMDSLTTMYPKATLTGEHMGRLFRDFATTNGQGIKYETLADLIDNARYRCFLFVSLVDVVSFCGCVVVWWFRCIALWSEHTFHSGNHLLA